jgi:hypothetical protein
VPVPCPCSQFPVISYQAKQKHLAAIRICENLYNQNIIYRDVQDWQDKDLQAKDK